MTQPPSLAMLLPNFSELPLFSSQLKAMVAIGTFVCCNGKIYRTLRHESIVENPKSSTTIISTEYFPISESKIKRRALLQASLSPFKELVQGSETTSIRASDIDEVAFVFHENNFAEKHLAHGCTLSYLVRYTDKDEYIDSDTFYCFPDLSPNYPLNERSFVMEVFQELSRIADASATILTRAAESQGRSGSAQVYVSPRTSSTVKLITVWT